MNRYRGARDEHGQAVVTLNGNTFDPLPSQKIRNHSPDGFEWGYGGSGPAQLALGILCQEKGPDLALDYYQSFKWEFVARFGSVWELTSQDVDDWLFEFIPKAVEVTP